MRLSERYPKESLNLTAGGIVTIFHRTQYYAKHSSDAAGKVGGDRV